MNSITVAGPIGRDAETKFLPAGDAVASFSVADSQGRDKPTIWWACSLYGKRAESLAQYLVKGTYVTVSGTVTEREYVNRDGIKVKAMDLRVNDVALQGKAQGSGATEGYQGGTGAKDTKSPREAARDRQAAACNPAPSFSDMDDDIPF